MTKTLLPISVIMPLFNDEKHVIEALRSLTEGSTEPAEIIVVDNASVDGSAAAVEGLGLSQLRLVRNDENVGAARARDQALALASHSRIMFLDSDDWVSPDALQLAMQRMDESGSDLVILKMRRMSLDGSETLFALEPPARTITGKEALELTLGDWRIDSRGLYERATYDRARALFTPHGFSDDEILSRLIFAEARQVVGCDGVYFYRLNTKSYTFDKVVGQTVTNIRSVALGAEHLGADHPATRAMRDVAVRNLAGLVVRSLKGEGPLATVTGLSRDLQRLHIPFGQGNRRARLLDGMLRLLFLRARR